MKTAIVLLLTLWSTAGVFLYLESMFDGYRMQAISRAKLWKSVVNVIISGPIVIAIAVPTLIIVVFSETWGWFMCKYREWLYN